MHYKRKLVQGLVGVLIGAGLIVGGVLTRHVYLELAGAVVLVLSLLWGIVNWQQHRARVRAARARVKGKKPDRRKPPSGGRAGLMERLEERWRRRQEGDRRM